MITVRQKAIEAAEKVCPEVRSRTVDDGSMTFYAPRESVDAVSDAVREVVCSAFPKGTPTRDIGWAAKLLFSVLAFEALTDKKRAELGLP